MSRIVQCFPKVAVIDSMHLSMDEYLKIIFKRMNFFLNLKR